MDSVSDASKSSRQQSSSSICRQFGTSPDNVTCDHYLLQVAPVDGTFYNGLIIASQKNDIGLTTQLHSAVVWKIEKLGMSQCCFNVFAYSFWAIVSRRETVTTNSGEWQAIDEIDVLC